MTGPPPPAPEPSCAMISIHYALCVSSVMGICYTGVQCNTSILGINTSQPLLATSTQPEARSLLHSDSPTDRSICCLVEYVFSRAFRLSDLRRDCLTQDEMRMLSDRSDHICILRWLNASFSASI